MLGFSMMHQNARARLLPRTREKGIGTLCMFAVRNIFSKPDVLKRTSRTWPPRARCRRRWRQKAIRWASWCTRAVRKAWSTPPTASPAISPASTSCCSARATSAHLRSNIASILRPPLPAADVARLHETFGHLVGVGLDLPDRMQAAQKR